MPHKNAPQPYFLFGLVVSLSLTWAALEWTQFEWSDAPWYAAAAAPLDLLEAEVIPASVPVKPPPPPVPIGPPKVLPDPVPTPIGPPEPGPKPPEPVFFSGWDDLIGPGAEPVISSEPVTLLVADHMPAFDACVDVLDPDAERACTEQRIIEHMQQCVDFPRHMKDAGIDGVVYLEYVVDEFGNVRDARILKSPHAAFEATTLRCIDDLPQLNPGRQQGRPVRVQYTLPVRFSLH